MTAIKSTWYAKEKSAKTTANQTIQPQQFYLITSATSDIPALLPQLAAMPNKASVPTFAINSQVPSARQLHKAMSKPRIGVHRIEPSNIFVKKLRSSLVAMVVPK